MTTVLVIPTMAAVKVMTHLHGQTVAPPLQAVIPTTHVLAGGPTVRTMAIRPIRAAVLVVPIAHLQPKARGILRVLAVEQPVLMVKVAHTATSAAALTATTTLPTLAVGTTIAATAVEEAATAAQVPATVAQAQAAAVRAQVAAVHHADHAKWLEQRKSKQRLFQERDTV